MHNNSKPKVRYVPKKEERKYQRKEIANEFTHLKKAIEKEHNATVPSKETRAVRPHYAKGFAQ